MALTTSLLGILSALGAAGAWGGGDFCGGLATRRNHPTLVLLVAASTGLVVGLVLALLVGEPIPSWADVAWASAAGVLGGLGLMALYRGLALGASGGAGAALVAPVAAVVGAAVPVGIGSFLEGLPSAGQLTGIALGIGGIWLVTRLPGAGAVSPASASSPGFRLAVIAGLCFGSFFVLLAQVSPGHVFLALVVTKLSQVGMAAFSILSMRHKPGSIPELRLGLISGFLDAFGNVFFMIAAQYTRLDVASLLISMYPIGTVLLSGWVLKERVGAPQWAGIGLCLAAIALIAV